MIEGYRSNFVIKQNYLLKKLRLNYSYQSAHITWDCKYKGRVLIKANKTLFLGWMAFLFPSPHRWIVWFEFIYRNMVVLPLFQSDSKQQQRRSSWWQQHSLQSRGSCCAQQCQEEEKKIGDFFIWNHFLNTVSLFDSWRSRG